MRALSDDPSWIKRRVETVHIVDRHRIERYVTLDIDMDKALAIARATGLVVVGRLRLTGRSHREATNIEDLNGLFLPLTTLTKNLLIDFDVRDGQGKALSVATSDQDSRAAEAHLLATLTKQERRRLSFELETKLFDVAKSMPSEHDEAVLNSDFPTSNINAWALEGSLYGQADHAAWAACFDNNAFADLLASFTMKFSPLVWVPLSTPTVLVKFRIQEVAEISPAGPQLMSNLGFGASLYAISAPNVSKAGREHIRIIAPDGTYIAEALLARRADPMSRVPFPTITGDRYQYRVTPSRATLYTSHRAGPKFEHLAIISLRPLQHSFAWPSLISISVALVLLTLGSVGQLVRGTLDYTSSRSSGPAVALLLLASTGFAAYIAREGEHEIRSRMLLAPRLAVGTTGIATLAGAIVLVGDFSGHTQAIVWCSGAAYCLLVLICVAVLLIAARKGLKKTLRNSYRTEEDYIAEF